MGKVKVNFSLYRPGVAQRVGRGIALIFHDRGTIRGWVVSSTPRPHFTPGKDPVPILQEAGWASGPVRKGRKSRPYRDLIPDRPARSQSLYRLSYPTHKQPPVVDINYLSHNKVEWGVFVKTVMNLHVAQKAENVTSPMIIDHLYLVAVTEWSLIQCVWREHCGLCLTTTFVVNWWRVRTLIGSYM